MLTGLVLEVLKGNNSFLRAIGEEPKEFNKEQLKSQVKLAFGRYASEYRKEKVYPSLVPNNLYRRRDPGDRPLFVPEYYWIGLLVHILWLNIDFSFTVILNCICIFVTLLWRTYIDLKNSSTIGCCMKKMFMDLFFLAKLNNTHMRTAV